MSYFPNEKREAVDTKQAAAYLQYNTVTLQRWGAGVIPSRIKPIARGRGRGYLWAMADIRKLATELHMEGSAT